MTEDKERRPVTPGEYMPIARRLMRHRDEIQAAIKADAEEDVAGSDQAAAAADDARRQTAESIRDLGLLGIDPQQVDVEPGQARYLAWALAIGGAIPRRIPEDRRCRHAIPTARRPLTALLTSGLLFCDDCRSQFAAQFTAGADDGRCDVCDREATRFSEFTGTIGSLRVIGNICPMCRFWLDSLQRSG